MFSRKSAASKIAAFIKASFLNNLDGVIRRNAAKANLYLKTRIADAVFAKKTPGAFGNAWAPSTRPQFAGHKLARYCAARGKVRGY